MDKILKKPYLERVHKKGRKNGRIPQDVFGRFIKIAGVSTRVEPYYGTVRAVD